ncbi:MAG: hypothetical protein HC869_25695 [Rhodospirillales bacterium]|nr:hypothetical protein [Rhodospirillales bacterium]
MPFRAAHSSLSSIIARPLIAEADRVLAGHAAIERAARRQRDVLAKHHRIDFAGNSSRRFSV